MDPLFAQVDAREKGTQIPISIATALAIESSLGIMPEHETPEAPIREVETIWINIRTLFRNLLGAMPKEVRERVTPDILSQVINNEMQIIETSISQVAQGKVLVTFYNCTLEGLNRHYPYAQHRNPTTQNQRMMWQLEQATIQELLEASPAYDVRQFDLAFDDVNRRAFIVTHHAIDLLNRYRFSALTLLESHTGALKPPARFYTKLQNGKELSRIPFDRMTLQLFGEGVLFSPMNAKIRKHVEGIAEKNQWTPLTTKDYVISCIRKERDPVLEAFILRLY